MERGKSGILSGTVPSRDAEHSVTEDGPCRLAEVELAGAEVAAWDAATGKPLMIRYQLGKGTVYLMTVWAYPGHEQMQTFSAAWIAKLAEEERGDCYVEDPSREVFWTRWVEKHATRLMLLNTDWTQKGNRKHTVVHTPFYSLELDVTERVPVLLTLLPSAAFLPDAEVHLEILEAGEGTARLRLHGDGVRKMKVFRADGTVEIHELDFRRKTVMELSY